MLKKYLYLLSIMFLFSACTHREYFKVSSGGSGNIDKDLAQCEYEAEMNTQSHASQNVVVNVASNYRGETKEERKERERREDELVRQEEVKHDNQVRKLRDLCLRSRGWSWKIVDNK